MRQVVVLHGWSDDSESFKPLVTFLKRRGFNVTSLFLGDYVSLRDDVRIEDVAKRMEEVVREKMARPAGSSSRLNRTFDLIVHSTGGLLARWWITEYYRDRECPVRNLVMLAPANFGSVLAHKGRSMVGRLFKGFRNGFEVGEEMLHALELGSQFQWDLARRDLFSVSGDNAVYYDPSATRPFIITGTHPYRELSRKLINENGSDGTVRVAAANLNARGATVDFTADLKRPEFRPWRLRGGNAIKFPLAVLADRDHGSVIRPDAKGHSKDPVYDAKLGELIVEALKTNTAAQYRQKIESWRQVSMDTRTYAGSKPEAVRHRRRTFGRNPPNAAYFHEHFQLVIRAVDQYGNPIPEFFVEFFPKPKDLRRSSKFRKASFFFHDEVLEHTHANRRDPSRRVFFLDRYDLMKTEGGFYSMLAKNAVRSLAMTATATDPGDNVSYFEHVERKDRTVKPRGVVDLHGKVQADRWLNRHCTHFVELVIPRVGKDGLFRLKRA